MKIQPGRALYVNDEFISDFSWSIFIQKSGSKTSKIRNHIHYLLFPISFLSQYSNLQCQLRAWLLSSTIRFKWISRNVRWWRKIANFCFHSRIWIDAVGSRILTHIEFLMRNSLHWMWISLCRMSRSLTKWVPNILHKYIFSFLFSNFVLHSSMRAKFGHRTIDKEESEHKQVLSVECVFAMLWSKFSLHYESILFSAIVCHHSHLNEHTTWHKTVKITYFSTFVSLFLACRLHLWCILTEFHGENKKEVHSIYGNFFLFFYSLLWLCSFRLYRLKNLWLLLCLWIRCLFILVLFTGPHSLNAQHSQLTLVLYIFL